MESLTRSRRSPTAELRAWTPNPFRIVHDMYLGERLCTDEHTEPATYDAQQIATDPEFTFAFELLREGWNPVLEFPTFVWSFVLPRSLHAQLRAHRFAWWSESNQMPIAETFARDDDYYAIRTDDAGIQYTEHVAMRNAQDSYTRLREQGVLPALARGVLPQHINLGLSGSMNLRAMFHMIVKRRCHILQGTYWNELLEIMCRELCEKVDERFGQLFTLQPCDLTGRCISNIEQRIRKDGKDPHGTCPRWDELQKTNGKSTCCGSGCVGCLKSATEGGRSVERSVKE